MLWPPTFFLTGLESSQWFRRYPRCLRLARALRSSASRNPTGRSCHCRTSRAHRPWSLSSCATTARLSSTSPPALRTWLGACGCHRPCSQRTGAQRHSRRPARARRDVAQLRVFLNCHGRRGPARVATFNVERLHRPDRGHWKACPRRRQRAQPARLPPDSRAVAMPRSGADDRRHGRRVSFHKKNRLPPSGDPC